MTGHIPAQPTWRCTLDGQPWPCPGKRAELLAEYDRAPTSLYVTMAMRMADASSDLRHLSVAELHDRFLRWVPRTLSVPPEPRLERPYVQPASPWDGVLPPNPQPYWPGPDTEVRRGWRA